MVSVDLLHRVTTLWLRKDSGTPLASSTAEHRFRPEALRAENEEREKARKQVANTTKTG